MFSYFFCEHGGAFCSPSTPLSLGIPPARPRAQLPTCADCYHETQTPTPTHTTLAHLHAHNPTRHSRPTTTNLGAHGGAFCSPSPPQIHRTSGKTTTAVATRPSAAASASAATRRYQSWAIGTDANAGAAGTDASGAAAGTGANEFVVGTDGSAIVVRASAAALGTNTQLSVLMLVLLLSVKVLSIKVLLSVLM